MATIEQSGQTVQGPQINSGRDAIIERIGDNYNYEITNAEFKVPEEVVRQILVASGVELPEDISVAVLKTQSWEPDTVYFPAGSFMMGAEPGKGISPYESPPFKVSLLAYRIGYRPVSNAEFYHYLHQTGQIAASELGWRQITHPTVEEADRPVYGVTWHEARKYCDWLAADTGRPYTLPSEAQWERSAREVGKLLAMVDHIREWTTSLWGEKRRIPDIRYQYPRDKDNYLWVKDNGRDNLKVNDQVRRVTRGGTPHITRRSSEFPTNRGWNSQRIGFRVVLNQEES